ncbi:uncharacterized protein LOC115981112 [Quercus lobata]|uniref:uncharacterized protein LOC115981112 n=1 Tax=Quercus lobata TaxID=97700 RepID=UPI0012443B94|nr:uncharacterized protein LOC115981112 [Quercus lobata]
MQADLARAYTSEEVDAAIKEMVPLKALGLDETESAFTANRLITNNILIAFETLHHMKTNYTGKKGFVALKMDMSKANDRVEWIFLEKIILKMGFQASWVAMIMECINTISYSILKGLMPSLDKEGRYKGFFSIQEWTKTYPLIFVDDCLIFCISTLEECQKIQILLVYYEAACGQMINQAKTTIFFGKNTDDQTQEAVKLSLRVLAIQHYEKYLGLPSFIGRNKKTSVVTMKEQIWARMQGWKAKLLSQARRS